MRQQAKGPETQRHALAVAAILADVGMDQDTIAVGLLNSAVGEGLLSLAEVAPVMGMQVRAAVVANVPRDAEANTRRTRRCTPILTHHETGAASAGACEGQVLQLLHDTTRVRDIPKRLDVYDDDSAEHLRRFCLAFHDIRAVSCARRPPAHPHTLSFSALLDSCPYCHALHRYAPLLPPHSSFNTPLKLRRAARSDVGTLPAHNKRF